MVDRMGVIQFWLDEVGPAGWYGGGEELDEKIRARYAAMWENACRGELDRWLSDPAGMFAYIIVTDQFPRNMFREDARAFATDLHARRAAGLSIHRKWDLQIPEPQRQFFYLPLMHSENLPDQNQCVRLILTRMPETGADNLLHARAHREIIRRFGRFPYRNAALGRESSPAEREFLAAGGYMAALNAVRAPA